MAKIKKIIADTYTNFKNIQKKQSQKGTKRGFIPKSNWDIVNDILSIESPKKTKS